MQYLADIITDGFSRRTQLSPTSAEPELREAVTNTLNGLTEGRLRVAECINGHWHTHAWIKQAVLVSFCLHANQIMSGGFSQFYDKVPLQFTDLQAATFAKRQLRIVPPACIRHGSYIGDNSVIMPSFINIGAHVGSGCMIDTWATVGSCAQIGNHVHISGGTGIGGVLEPLQASPTIIEDNCFIGARSEIVEGVIVEANSVIAMGVFIGQSTPIYDRTRGTTLYGRVPAGSVVVPGSRPGHNGEYQLNCAVIVKTVDAKTRAKVGINHLLREAQAEAAHA